MYKLFNRLVLDYPKAVIGILVIVTIFFASFLPGINFDADMENMIPKDDPVIKELGDTIKQFGSQDFIMVALRADNIFQQEVLEKIDQLSGAISELDGVQKVMNPLNLELIESSITGIEISKITEDVPRTPSEIEEYRESILNSDQAESFITEDGRAALLMVTLKPLGTLSTQKMKALIGEIDRIVENYQGPEEIYIVGDAYAGHYAQNAMETDMIVLVPLIFLLLISILYWSFHSWRGVLLPMLTVLISVVWTLGLMVMLDIPITIVTMVMPVILVAIGSADGIHILNKYYEALAEGQEKRKALEATMTEMNSPVIMTSLTTGAGFAALITSFIPPVRQFGILTAFGVLAAMFFSLLFIPASLALQKLPAHFEQEKREHKEWLVRRLGLLGRLVARNSRRVLLISFLLLL
ncbi:MAG: efflux RND transporter permease subunit, partial [Halanaerobium sp.]|nr:efflux RND transporter permease subunit [Halanaerobium sp.]